MKSLKYRTSLIFKENYLLFAVMGLFLLGKILLWDIYFFWDSATILSMPAHFLYENNFSPYIFPDNFVDDNEHRFSTTPKRFENSFETGTTIADRSRR